MPRVFSVGDLNVDLFTHTASASVPGEEHRAEKFYCSIGGNAANFAVSLSALGEKVLLVSVLGKDLFTEFLSGALGRFSVDTVLLRSKKQNGVSNIFVSPGGERAIISSKGCLSELSCAAVKRKIVQKLSAGDIVFFGGYFHLTGMRKGFSGMLKAIKRKGALVFFDACFDEFGKWKTAGFLGQVDALFLNRLELRKITGSRNERKAIAWLFSRGVKSVVLKRGAEGASFFSCTELFDAPAFQAKALNTTGAGDFFNAGLVHGLLRDFSPRNCLLCGNFVAGKKVSSAGYYVPSKRELDAYISCKNLAEVEIVENYSALSRRVSRLIIEQLREKPDSVLCLAAGKTPLRAYSLLVRAHRRGLVDFSRAAFIELDEYLGLENHVDSFAHSLAKNFLDKVNFRKRNVFLFNQHAKNQSAECRRIESIVRRKGIDFMFLGLGENAHIAFNEPGTPFSSHTHVAKIPRAALRARKAEFSGRVPEKAFTLGLRTIFCAKKIVLAASGRKKSGAVRKAFSFRPSERAPASVLQKHGNALVVLDKPAARLLNI